MTRKQRYKAGGGSSVASAAIPRYRFLTMLCIGMLTVLVLATGAVAADPTISGPATVYIDEAENNTANLMLGVSGLEMAGATKTYFIGKKELRQGEDSAIWPDAVISSEYDTMNAFLGAQSAFSDKAKGEFGTKSFYHLEESDTSVEVQIKNLDASTMEFGIYTGVTTTQNSDINSGRRINSLTLSGSVKTIQIMPDGAKAQVMAIWKAATPETYVFDITTADAVSVTASQRYGTSDSNTQTQDYVGKITGGTTGYEITSSNALYYHNCATESTAQPKTYIFDLSNAPADTYSLNDGTYGQKFVIQLPNLDNEVSVSSGTELKAAVGHGFKNIKFANDISGDGIVVEEGQDVTIDLNGFTYNIDGTTVGSSGTETNGMQLLKTSTVLLKNGTITSSKAKLLIQNYADLTLDDVDLSFAESGSAGYGVDVVSNNFGSLTVTGDTNITAKEGNYAFDLYYWPENGYPEGVTVTFDNEFTGSVSGVVGYDADQTVSGKDWTEKAKLTINGGKFDVDFVISSQLSDISEANIVSTIPLGVEITGPAKVTAGVKAVYTANTSFGSGDFDSYVWKVNDVLLPEYTKKSMEYTFPSAADYTISVEADGTVGAASTDTYTVNVEAAKPIPAPEEQEPAEILPPTTGTPAPEVKTVNFSSTDSTQSITITVSNVTGTKAEEHKEKIPEAEEVVAVYEFEVENLATQHDMAVIKLTVTLPNELTDGKALQAYRFNNGQRIQAMPLQTEYFLNRSATVPPDKWVYEVTIYTPGFSEFSIAVQSTPTMVYSFTIDETNLYEDETSKVGILEGGSLVLPVIFETDDTTNAPTSFDFTTKVYNLTAAGSPEVTGLTYTYVQNTSATISQFDVDQIDSSKLVASGFTPADNQGLFDLTISGSNLAAGSQYKAEISINNIRTEAGTPGAGGTTVSGSATLSLEFNVNSWLVNKADNVYNNTAANPWNFSNPVVFDYVVRAQSTNGVENWPAVPRFNGAVTYLDDAASDARKAAVHPLSFAESQTAVSKTEQLWTADAWTATTAETVTNTSGKIKVVVGEADKNAAYLKITYTGYKVGDVIGSNNKVDLADIDALLQESATGLTGTFVADARKIYADIDHDGGIDSDDALYIFKHYLGYDTNKVEELIL